MLTGDQRALPHVPEAHDAGADAGRDHGNVIDAAPAPGWREVFVATPHILGNSEWILNAPGSMLPRHRHNGVGPQ